MNQNTDEKTLSDFIVSTGIMKNAQPDNVVLQLLIVDSAFNVYRTRTEASIQQSLAEYFFQPVATRIIQGPDEGFKFQPYDPTVPTDPSVIWQKPANSVDNYVNISQQILGNLDELKVFSDDAASIDGVGALAVLVSMGDDAMIIFQQFIQRNVLKNSARIKVAFSGASFKEIAEQAVFQISRDNHVVAYKDDLYILEREPL